MSEEAKKITLVKWHRTKWHIHDSNYHSPRPICFIYASGMYEKQEVETLPNEGVCKKCRQEWEQRNDA